MKKSENRKICSALLRRGLGEALTSGMPYFQSMAFLDLDSWFGLPLPWRGTEGEVLILITIVYPIFHTLVIPRHEGSD
jgi:hypothetical protein